MASTYADFLKPQPSRGWSDFEHTEQAELLNQEQVRRKEQARATRERNTQAKRERRASRSIQRRERWQRLFGDRKQQAVFGAAAFLVALGLTLYFVIPRAPNVSWHDSSSQASFFSDNATATYTNAPATFDFSAILRLDVDTKSSYITTSLRDLLAVVIDSDGGAEIATGRLNRAVSMPSKTISTVKIPLHFEATFANSTDLAFSRLVGACTSNSTNLGLVFSLKFNIAGLIGSKGARLQDTFRCPVTLIRADAS